MKVCNYYSSIYLFYLRRNFINLIIKIISRSSSYKRHFLLLHDLLRESILVLLAFQLVLFLYDIEVYFCRNKFCVFIHMFCYSTQCTNYYKDGLCVFMVPILLEFNCQWSVFEEFFHCLHYNDLILGIVMSMMSNDFRVLLKIRMSGQLSVTLISIVSGKSHCHHVIAHLL